MTINAAQLMVTVGANTAAAEQGIMGIGRLLGPGGVLGLGAIGAAAAIAGIGIASTKMAGDFQSGMLSIVTGAGESQSNLKLISDGVLQLARDTGTSTKQLTDGLYMIESAGFHGAAGLDILKVAAEGAKVGNADLGTTADALTTILKDYPNVTGGATGAMNLLIATVANGKTHMQDLAGSLSQVLPMAQNAGIGLNDVMGAMATMTGEGVPAAEAATYLRQTLLMLNAPSAQAKKALESVGLTTDEVSAAMKKSLPDALQMITDAVGKKFKPGSAEYMAAIKDIVGGTRTVQGMLDLTGAHMKDFQQNVQNVTGAVKKGGDQVAGWSLVQQTFNQKMDVLKQTVETLMIALGTKLLPVAGRVADFFSHALSGAFTTVEKPVNAVSGAVKTTGESMQLLTGRAKGASDTLQKTLGVAAKELGGIFTTDVVPIVKALGDIFTTDVLPASKILAAFFVSDVLPVVKQLGDFARTTLVPILHTFADVLTHNVLPAILPVVHTILTKWLPPLQRIMKDVLPVLNPLLQTLGWIFQNVIGPALNWVAGLIGNALDGVANLTDGISNFVKNPAVQSFFTNITKINGNIMGALHNIPGFAAGGTMSQGGLALVGEAGPELVQLPGGAQITPMAQLSGGSPLAPLGGAGLGAQNMTINLTVTSTLDGRRVAQSVARHLPYVVQHGVGGRA